MSFLALLLTVWSVEQTEGYDMYAAICSGLCDARFDSCSSYPVSDEVCDNDYFSCIAGC